MKVYGQLDHADLQNLTAAPASPSVGRIYFDTTLGKFRFWDGSAWHNLVLEDSGLFTAPTTLAQVSSPSAPATGYQKIYPKSDGFLYTMDPSGAEKKIGSGAGSINYLSANPDAESGTTGYIVYQNTAQATPVTGTGGTPTHLTLTASSVAPLRGTKSFLITNSGGTSAQGEGISVPFQIDSADQAKVLTISLDYALASGTYLDGDLTVYIEDVTNSAIIQPAGYKILAAAIGLPVRFVASFQTPINSTSFRLIVHAASTSTSAYSIKLDNLSVGPTTIVQGTPVTDPEDVVPDLSAFGTVTNVHIKKSRVGKKLRVEGTFVTGTPTGNPARIGLPPGLALELANYGGANNTHIVGQAERLPPALTPLINEYSTAMTFGIAVDTNHLDSVFMAWNASGNQVNPDACNAMVGAGDTMSFWYEVDIAGWSSQVQMSDSASTRVVAATAVTNNSHGKSFAGLDIVPFDTLLGDTVGGFDTTTYTYTVKVPGWYSISGTIGFGGTTGGGQCNVQLYKNGAALFQTQNGQYVGGGAYGPATQFAYQVPLAVGDQIAIYAQALGSGLNTNSPYATVMNIHLLNGPSQVAASEKIRAKYFVNSSASTSSTQSLDFSVKVFDTHGAVTTGAGWQFKAPRADIYEVSVHWYQGGTTCSGFITKNGVADSYISSSTPSTRSGGTTLIYLKEGEVIDFRLDSPQNCDGNSYICISAG